MGWLLALQADACQEPQAADERVWRAPKDRVVADVVAADLDGDGRDELVVSLAPYVFLATDPSHVRPPVEQGFLRVGEGGGLDFRTFDGAPMVGHTSVVDDWDGDGDADVLLVGLGEFQYHRSEDGRFVEDAGALLVGVREQGASGAISGDVDGDGRPDLVLLRSMGLRIASWTGTAFELLATPWILGMWSARGAALHDVDGDGQADLVRVLEDRLEVLRNTGGGSTFEPLATTMLTSELSRNTVTDVAFHDVDCEPGPECLVLLRIDGQIVLRVYVLGDPVTLLASAICGGDEGWGCHLAVLDAGEGCRQLVCARLWPSNAAVVLELRAGELVGPASLETAFAGADTRDWTTPGRVSLGPDGDWLVNVRPGGGMTGLRGGAWIQLVPPGGR